MSAINLIGSDKFHDPLPDLEAVRLIYTHKKEQQENQTRAIFLSLDDLEDISKAIQKINKTDPEKTGNGVRFYMAKYPKKYRPVKGSDYSERKTVVAIPTFATTDKPSMHYDNIEAATVIECKKEIDAGHFNGGDGQDHYKLCPPDTDCDKENIIWTNL